MMKKYDYVLENDYHYFNEGLKGIYLATEYVFICNGYITIKKGYSWNGCSYVPDFQSTYYASLIHDALYQYHIGKKIADKVFFDIMKRDGFYLKYVYYYGVVMFGFIGYRF